MALNNYYVVFNGESWNLMMAKCNANTVHLALIIKLPIAFWAVTDAGRRPLALKISPTFIDKCTSARHINNHNNINNHVRCCFARDNWFFSGRLEIPLWLIPTWNGGRVMAIKHHRLRTKRWCVVCAQYAVCLPIIPLPCCGKTTYNYIAPKWQRAALFAEAEYKWRGERKTERERKEARERAINAVRMKQKHISYTRWPDNGIGTENYAKTNANCEKCAFKWLFIVLYPILIK